MVTQQHPTPQIVVMGASGSGKSTVGAALARSLEVAFVDADDVHPMSNIDKMRNGVPLDDADRLPWLKSVGHLMREHHEMGIVVACSALRVRYRDIIRSQTPQAFFVYLHTGSGLLAERLHLRSNHFMPSALLSTQLEALEPLGAHEVGCTLSGSEDVADLVYTAVQAWQHCILHSALPAHVDESAPPRRSSSGDGR